VPVGPPTIFGFLSELKIAPNSASPRLTAAIFADIQACKHPSAEYNQQRLMSHDVI
jgi:hypothetical protein